MLLHAAYKPHCESYGGEKNNKNEHRTTCELSLVRPRMKKFWRKYFIYIATLVAFDSAHCAVQWAGYDSPPQATSVSPGALVCSTFHRSLYHDLSVAERPIRSLYRYILHVACCYMQDINLKSHTCKNFFMFLHVSSCFFMFLHVSSFFIQPGVEPRI